MYKGPNEHWVDAEGRVHIRLSQGQEAVVTPATWEIAQHYRWWASDHKHTWYAASKGPHPIVYLHWLVAGRPQAGYDVNHKDGNGLNNLPSNLEILPHKKNTYHRNRAGTARNTSGSRSISHHSNGRGNHYWRYECCWDTDGHGCIPPKYFLYTQEGFEQACRFADHHRATVHPDCAGYGSSDVREPALIRVS